MKRVILAAAVVVMMASGTYASEEPVTPAAIPGLSGLADVELIKANRSMFSSNKPVTVPKSWKLIGVSNGEKQNNNNLWFQDVDGNIYLLDGTMDGKTFYLSGNIQKLEAK